MIDRKWATHPGGPPERLYAEEFAEWLLAQPQDAWLLFARTMNWDVFDQLALTMIDHPDCDIAVATRIFWSGEPSYDIERPGARDSICRRIIANVKSGRYQASALAFDRLEILYEVHGYLRALADPKSGGRSLDVPRILFGPFTGRKSTIPAPDEATRRHLDEIEAELGFTLPMDHGSWSTALKDRELFVRFHPLPKIPRRPWAKLPPLPEAAYIERLYGRNADFEKARHKHFRAIDPFAKRSALSLGPAARIGRSDRLILIGLGLFAILAIGGAIVARMIAPPG